MILGWSSTFLLLVIFAQIFSTTADVEFCSRTPDCIRQVRKLISQTNRFWFGDSWRLSCGGFTTARLREQNPIKCLNPRELTPFLSLGARLFHARTFTAGYLQNLSVFPRITFALQPGTYRACDHDFTIRCNKSHGSAHPEMEPLDPFLSRHVPEITWPELELFESYVLLLVDAGFGALKYLVVDFPHSPRVLRTYETVDNFRHGQPTPLVLLVFRGRPAATESIGAARDRLANERIFDLTGFMMEHELENDLIGVNWAMIGADAYAMERQRLRGSVDNCHALVQRKLQRESSFEWSEIFPLSEMDSSVSVSFRQPAAHFEVCCQRVDLEEKEVFADPLADAQLPSGAVRNLPAVVSLRSIEYETENYQRSLRHYITMKEDRYSLIMFDPHRQYLHWMLTDVPSGALVAGTLMSEANRVADYVVPVPAEPGQCTTIVLMLLRQPRSQHPSEISQFYNEDHAFRSKHCSGHCIHRSGFDVAQFKSFHRLRFSAVTWFRVCFDVHEAMRQIRQLKQVNTSTADSRPHSSTSGQTKRRQKSRTISGRHQEARELDARSVAEQTHAICEIVNADHPQGCDLMPSSSQVPTTFVLSSGFLLVALHQLMGRVL